MRLDVGVLGAEETAGELRRLALDVVDVLAPGVEAMRWVALGVLVREQRSLCELRRQGAVVLARDELHVGALIAQLVDDRRGDARRRGRDVIEHRVQGGGRGIGGTVPDALEILRQQAHTPLLLNRSLSLARWTRSSRVNRSSLVLALQSAFCASRACRRRAALRGRRRRSSSRAPRR